MGNKIVKVAVKVGNKVYSGWDYDECFNQISEADEDIECGFIDEKGNFYDSIIAKQIAVKANQISPGHSVVLFLTDMTTIWLKEQEELIRVMREKLKPCPECGEPMGTSEFHDENGSHCLRCEEKKALWYPLSEQYEKLKKENENLKKKLAKK